jgi:phospholipase D1/2
LKTSPYKRLHRYGSFAPIRTSNCKWYVDGIDYFSDVCDAIKKAKETVYITDWWLSPELFLKRPVDVRPFA